MQFDYFYPEQADQYAFYRIPRRLFTDNNFKELTAEAKILYGLMLDRVSLSLKNMWIDKSRRVYIIFTLKEVMDTLNCGDKKATRLMGELEKCGLIERDRRGLGKPNLIYVKNFNSGVPTNERFQTRQNDDSGVGNMEIQDTSEQRGTNTNKNYIDMNNTNPILSSEEIGTEENAVNEWTMMYQYFWNQLYFEYLLMDYPLERDSLEEILEILVDTCCSNRKMIRIAGDDKPKEVVKSRLMKLEREHIQYVMKCLNENSTKVRNMKQYVLATLYNAPLTISNFHKSWVNYDMANGLI